MSRGHVPPPAAEGADAVAPAVRAQLLATEHWSLLATRSMTQNEVLSRITMFLMLVSASIVSLALIAQATHFSGRFMLGPTPVVTPLASSGAFIALLNAALTGVFAALVAVGLHAPRVVVAVAAAAGFLSFLGVTLTRGPLAFKRVAAAHVPLFPASGSGAAGVD
jgi:hypothetical protein